jgi:hypothetical protein
MVSRQMNMNNMRRQAYGVWKPPPHMPLTIAGVLKKNHFFVYFPFTKIFLLLLLHHVTFSF